MKIAASVQAHTIFGNVAKSVSKALELIKDASSNGAELIVFPEVFLGGYPRGMSFGCSVGVRTLLGRKEFVNYQAQAIKIPGPETVLLANAAKKYKVNLIIGVLEIDPSCLRGTLYCTMLIFNNLGQLIHKHRKLKPTSAERYILGEGNISTVKAVETNFGKVGGLICWENKMPLVRNQLYEQGVEIYVAPTADGRDGWISTMQHIAQEGGCFVIAANQYAKVTDIYDKDAVKTLALEDSSGNSSSKVLYNGGSLICNPMGTIIAGPLRDQEGIIYAEIDLQEINQAKFDFDVVGHYRSVLNEN